MSKRSLTGAWEGQTRKTLILQIPSLGVQAHLTSYYTIEGISLRQTDNMVSGTGHLSTSAILVLRAGELGEVKSKHIPTTPVTFDGAVSNGGVTLDLKKENGTITLLGTLSNDGNSITGTISTENLKFLRELLKHAFTETSPRSMMKGLMATGVVGLMMLNSDNSKIRGDFTLVRANDSPPDPAEDARIGRPRDRLVLTPVSEPL